MKERNAMAQGIEATHLTPPVRIGVVAPSYPVGPVELSAGARVLREAGFEVAVHPQCELQHFLFAGRDDQRARAIFEYANDEALDVVWAASGGYGAARVLPELEKLTERDGPPPPGGLLVGYSDCTALFEYVRTRWNWHAMHARMICRDLARMAAAELRSTLDLVARRPVELSWRLDVTSLSRPVSGSLVGGNLSVLASLAGTPWLPSTRGRFVFVEDVGEDLYRIDRMVNQLSQCGFFDGAVGVVVGSFRECVDLPREVLVDDSPQAPRRPLRAAYPIDEALRLILAPVADRAGVPLATGLPVGHTPDHAPLPLDATYELAPDGTFRMTDWSWLQRKEEAARH